MVWERWCRGQLGLYGWLVGSATEGLVMGRLFDGKWELQGCDVTNSKATIVISVSLITLSKNFKRKPICCN